MRSTILKRNSHQYQIHKKHITSITTPLRANFIIHASSLGDRAIYTDHTCRCVHVCLCLCMSVYEAQMHVDRGKQCECVCESRAVLRLCVWGLRGSVCACVCEAEMSLCACFHLAHPDHYDPPAAYKPFHPWEERWGICFIEMWTEIRAVSTHLSSGQYQGPFHIFIQANLDPLLEGLAKGP